MQRRQVIKAAGFLVAISISGVVFAFIGLAITLSGALSGISLSDGIWGIAIGYPLGIIIGLILLNRFLHNDGSLMGGIAGSIVGATFTIGLDLINLNPNGDILFVGFWVATPLLSATGYHLAQLLKAGKLD